jgi:hypothetical protein
VNTTTKYRPAADVPKSFHRFSPFVSCRDDRVGPLDGFFNFRWVYSVPMDMAHIVQIPIEALNTIEQA